MNPPFFILQGNGPYHNRGCEAILRSTHALLREKFGPCTIMSAGARGPALGRYDIDVIDNPPPERRTLAWVRWEFRRTVLRHRQSFEHLVPGADAVLALGGDNFSLDYSHPKKFFEAARTVHRRKKPFILWGASVGPFSRDPEFEKFAAEVLGNMTLICAREPETMAYLKSIGITHNVRRVADPAFLLAPKPVALPEKASRFLEEGCLGVNLSPLLQKYLKQDKPWLEAAVELVSGLVREFGKPVLLIPHVFTPKNDDYEFLRDLQGRLSPVIAARVDLIGNNYNCEELKWIISRVRLFIGARTHATIAAFSSLVPTISISYSIKSIGINKDIHGHADWVVPLEQLTPEYLNALTHRLLGEAAGHREHLARFIPTYRELARGAGDLVRDIVRPASRS